MAYNPYYGNPNMQPMSFNNQYYGQPMQPIQPIQPQIQRVEQVQQTFKPGLQGKSVDNIEVVKAMDIPLDGTISYFPLTDGSAIVTKQLQADGTSKTIVYKQTTEEENANQLPKYITVEEFNENMKKINNNDMKEEIKTIKRQIKELVEDIRDINHDIKERRD